MMDVEPGVYACPSCRAALEPRGPDELRCPADGLSFTREGGIWRMLLPERRAELETFIREYERVREGEGRGSPGADFYRALPYRDLSGRWSADWRIRAAGFDALVRQVIQPWEERAVRPLSVLDLGAGNGWLSSRLAQRGHRAWAVDLLVNEKDGLGCRRFYEADFTPVQAEFDRLPFPDAFADLVVFNASFHYSARYEQTLAEAARALRAGGTIAVLDSPVYRDPGSGRRMVEERERQFLAAYGFASNSLGSENFLTYRRLDELASWLGLRMRRITPEYGLGWAWRQVKARLLARREAAKFHLVIFNRM